MCEQRESLLFTCIVSVVWDCVWYHTIDSDLVQNRTDCPRHTLAHHRTVQWHCECVVFQKSARLRRNSIRLTSIRGMNRIFTFSGCVSFRYNEWFSVISIFHSRSKRHRDSEREGQSQVVKRSFFVMDPRFIFKRRNDFQITNTTSLHTQTAPIACFMHPLFEPWDKRKIDRHYTDLPFNIKCVEV